MTYLPDVNVWIALYSPGHIHHQIAVTWFDQSGSADLVFCRVTQMGFLRLLTNRHVMGFNALSPSGAWMAIDQFLRNARVFFSAEPPDLENTWRGLVNRLHGGNDAWTDAYLEAFAMQAGFTLATFDVQIARRKNVSVYLLK